MQNICGSCQFFVNLDLQDEEMDGECRFHPPSMVTDLQGLTVTGFPRVMRNYLCGEYVQREPDWTRGKCIDCKFFHWVEVEEIYFSEDDEDEEYPSECRRNPPILLYNKGQTSTEFPSGNTKWWCGKWEPK